MHSSLSPASNAQFSLTCQQCTVLSHLTAMHSSLSPASNAQFSLTCQQCTVLSYLLAMLSSLSPASNAQFSLTCQQCTVLSHLPAMHSSLSPASNAQFSLTCQQCSAKVKAAMHCSSHYSALPAVQWVSSQLSASPPPPAWWGPKTDHPNPTGGKSTPGSAPGSAKGPAPGGGVHVVRRYWLAEPVMAWREMQIRYKDGRKPVNRYNARQ